MDMVRKLSRFLLAAFLLLGQTSVYAVAKEAPQDQKTVKEKILAVLKRPVTLITAGGIAFCVVFYLLRERQRRSSLTRTRDEMPITDPKFNPRNRDRLSKVLDYSKPLNRDLPL